MVRGDTNQGGGLNFTQTSHDIFSMGSNSVPGSTYWIHNGHQSALRGTWDYKWESTAGYSTQKNGQTYGTIFVKLTSNYLNAGHTY